MPVGEPAGQISAAMLKKGGNSRIPHGTTGFQPQRMLAIIEIFSQEEDLLMAEQSHHIRGTIKFVVWTAVSAAIVV